ncbi:arylamine N-acetyltransferase [Streptomyces sp. NPDC007094]|uniref:arylamine N-acetyltransferase family protein n=1 Tax=Streptomyces sp. NPDC007094 TaxID=3155359 RepID=UPI0033D58B7B
MSTPGAGGPPPSAWKCEQVDVEAYARRVGLRGPAWPVGADEDALCLLHRAHASAIPFDNLDFVTGVPVALDPPALVAKLCRRPRGGCCHEHNLLFGCIAQRQGFHVDRLAARVLLGGEGPRPRTHMALRVRHGRSDWLCDVGFGVERFLDPLELSDGATCEQAGRRYRVRALRQPFWAVELKEQRGWTAMYSFTLEPQHPMDFTVAHHFLSTHPRSMLRRSPLLQLTTPERRLRLHGLQITEDSLTSRATRTLTPFTLRSELAALGIRLPSGQLSDLARRLFPTPKER